MAKKETLFKKTKGNESAKYIKLPFCIFNLPSWLTISLASVLGLDFKPILCYPYSWTPFHILVLPSHTEIRHTHRNLNARNSALLLSPCCCLCLPCLGGTISSSVGIESCSEYPIETMSNPANTECVALSSVYISYSSMFEEYSCY